MRALAAMCLAAALAACSNPERTVEIARKEIIEFRAQPDDARQAVVERTLARLEQEIGDLRASGKTARADALSAQLSSLRAEFNAAKLARSMKDAANAFQGIGEALKEAGRGIGDAFKTRESD